MRVMGSGGELPVGSTGPVSPPGWLTASMTRLEKGGLREAHGGGWAGWRGTPKYSREDRDAEAEPQGVFSQKGGEMKGHSQPPPHTVWFTGSSHTHQVCTQT